MKLKSARFKEFRRFGDLSIEDLPPAKLVILAGPNGTGKSSLFDGFSVAAQSRGDQGVFWDKDYHLRPGNDYNWNQAVQVELWSQDTITTDTWRKAFYFRTAYRNDPDFKLDTLSRVGSAVDERHVNRMIQSDIVVSMNYQRLVSQAFADVFTDEWGTTTIEEFRENVLGQIRNSVQRLFPELRLQDLGDPLREGTFRFDKGATKGFVYKNLSGGEKAAFDLILDLTVKLREYDDTIFCIDEPEAHLNPRLQRALLEELYSLIPAHCQLWLATHSIGMMRRASELAETEPDSVLFLDFGEPDFDKPVKLSPVQPTRAFWERALAVALDDLASLVAPRQIVICEGNPGGISQAKNAEHDAQCYNTIFGDAYPDTKFLSGGSSKEVTGDRLAFAAALPRIANGIQVVRLIDRDDHAPAEVSQFQRQGIRVLRRRHIESYLWDDEVLAALCRQEGKETLLSEVQSDKQFALAASVGRGNPTDDMKSAAGDVYVRVKRRLDLRKMGNDPYSFARYALAPLVKPGMAVYEELKEDIFGP